MSLDQPKREWKNLRSDYEGYEAPIADNQQTRLSTLSAVGASPILTGSLIDASSELARRTEEMKGMMDRLKASGVDVQPLRMCLWNYAKAFAQYKCLRLLKLSEDNIHQIVSDKEI